MSNYAEDAMSQARKVQPAWAALSAHERSRKLRHLRHILVQRINEILQVISDEVGKPPMDALTGDVLVTLEQMDFYERKAAKILRSRKRGKPCFIFSGTHFEEFFEPHGVVLIFAPWNYPLQLSILPMITALFVGNAVLLKCSQRVPRTASLIEALCKEAALPEGLVQISWSSPKQAESLLDSRPDMIFFTGSSSNGRFIAERTATWMIPTVMELGGKDAAVVFASCDLERTVSGLVYGSFSNAGQVCVGTKRIYVEQSVYEEFLLKFVERVAQLRIGTVIESDLGPIRFQDVRQRLREQVQEAIAHGARAHTEVQWNSEEIKPIVLTEVAPDTSLLLDESFGPVVCIAPFQQEAEAVVMANSTGFALSASVWTGNVSQGQRISLQLQCGTCAINDVIRNIGNPQATFGGNGLSGHGRYHGEEGLRTFSRVRTVMTAHRLHNTEVHWFPFRTNTFHRLRALLIFRHGKGNIWKRLWSLTKTFTILLAFFCSVIAQAEQHGDLKLDVVLPPHAHGKIAYLIFTASKGFPNRQQDAFKHDFVPIANKAETRQQIDIGLLPPGQYAVSLYLDLNNNRQLDKNWLGIPREPVGASNNPKGRMGPPRFNECSFMHGSNSETISINLVQP